jgi:WD40 repeat protein
MNTHTNSRTWMALVILVLAVIIAIAGIIYGWQANVNSKIANQSLATAQADEQGMSSQVALAESTAQAALRQQANAEREAQEARTGQATAESDAQQRALVEALTDQEVQAAQEETRLATSRWLAEAAVNNLEIDPQLSAHLALQAIEAGQTFEAETALHQVLPNLRMVKPTPFKDILPYAENWQDVIWSLARDSKFLIQATDEGIKVIDLATGMDSILRQAKSCDRISATHDGHWLVAWCTNRWEIWDTKTATIIGTRPEYRIYHTDFNGYSLGQYDIISPSSTHPLMVYIWDPKQIRVEEAVSSVERYIFLPAEGSSWRSAVLSPDGRHMVAIDYQGQMVMWNMDSGAEILRYKAGSYFYIHFSSDGTRLLFAGASIRIYDVSLPSQEPALLQELSLKSRSDEAVFNSDGSKLAISFYDGTLQLWDIKTGRVLLSLYRGSELSGSIAFSRDGNRLYYVSWDGTAMEWDISGVMNGWIGTEPYSPDGSRLAIASEGGFVSILDSQTAEVYLAWQAYTKWMGVGPWFADIVWSPDGEHIATINNLDKPRIWDVATGTLLNELPISLWGIYPGIRWSPDGSQIVTIDYEIILWDANTGEKLLTLEGFDWGWGKPDLDFSPDGTKIAAGHCIAQSQDYCSYRIVIWDATDGKELFRLEPESPQSIESYLGGIFFALGFSPDGQYLAAGTPEGIVLWKLSEDGALQEKILTTQARTHNYFSLAFSPDGALLAASYGNGKFSVWDLETGQARWEMAGGGDVAFSPDGTRLALTNNGVTTVHVLPLDELTELMRSRIIRPMTPEECRTYLHQETCPAWP